MFVRKASFFVLGTVLIHNQEDPWGFLLIVIVIIPPSPSFAASPTQWFKSIQAIGYEPVLGSGFSMT